MPTTVQIPYIDSVEFFVATVAVGDNKAKCRMPFKGEVLEITGWLATLGTGAGTSTDIQLRNETQGRDLFSSKPTFEVDTATGLLEGGILIASPVFNQNDVLVLDIDAISTGPATMYVRVTCRFIYEVDV